MHPLLKRFLAAIVMFFTGWSGIYADGVKISDITDETPVFITIGQSNADGTANFNEEEDARLRAWYDSGKNPGLMKIWYRSCYIKTSESATLCPCYDGTGEQVDAGPGWMDLWYRNENTFGRTAMNMHSHYGTWSTGEGNYNYAQNKRGMEGEFGMRYQTAYPDKDLYIIKLGCGGSPIQSWTSDNNHNWEYFYRNMFLPAMNDLLAKGKKPRLAGVWWMQGCKDRNNTEEYYRTRLTELISKIRMDLGFPDAHIYIGHIVKPGENPDYPNSSKQFGQSVRNAQDAVTDPANEHYIPGTEIIDGRDCPFDADNLHWAHKGVNMIGGKIAERVIAAGPENWATFTTPGKWRSRKADSPEFIPYCGNPRISYTVADGIITAKLDYGTWSETKITKVSLSDAVYVKEGASGTGESWEDAIGSLQDALRLATEETIGDIYVANGCYELPCTLVIPAGITVTGGFPGNGDEVTVTNTGRGEVIILDAGSESERAQIRNLTVSGATSGRGVTAKAYAGISNCVVENNVIDTNADVVGATDGAGIYISDNVTVENCIVRCNKTKGVGGGISLNGKNAVVRNCLVYGNVSEGGYKSTHASAGGILAWANKTGCKVINTTIVRNKGLHVGGIWIGGSNSSCRWINCIIWGNEYTGSPAKGEVGFVNEISYPAKGNKGQTAIACYSSQITQVPDGMKNQLASDNITLDNAGIKGPFFNDPDNGDFTLSASSPLIESGDNGEYGAGLQTDFCIGGNRRLTGEKIDVGAYEFDSERSDVGDISQDEYYYDGNKKEYFSLDGLKLDGFPTKKGIYLENRGNRTYKILIK